MSARPTQGKLLNQPLNLRLEFALELIFQLRDSSLKDNR